MSAVYNKGGGGGSGESKAKPSVSAAGHTHDKGYSKWHKFDVDAAMRSVDEEDGGTDEKVWDENSSRIDRGVSFDGSPQM